MKMISKIAKVALGLVFIGSSVFAQSLDDAKNAIDAEQYQKAKAMLKNLTVTQSTKDENFFYLGWVYILQDYTDSAKMAFNKGLAVNSKSALNYAGLGVAARLDKDQAGATSNFNQAIALAPKKDSKPFLYIGKGYLILPVGVKTVAAADADAAIAVLNQGKAANPKDAEISVVIGDAYRSQLKSTAAYDSYTEALALDPRSLTANVAIGVLWRYTQSWDEAEQQYQKAIAIDPNFGPAYREWAETDLSWALAVRAVASAKVKEAVEHYQKFMSLTDQSVESLMRYADFLIDAGDYKTLQDIATSLSKQTNTNARVYRYLGYSAFENKDYPAGITAMNTWFAKADPKRIIPRDYLYLGRLQIASGQDSIGITTLKKAIQLDSTYADVYKEIGNALYAKKKFVEAGDAYAMNIAKSQKLTLNDYVHEGTSYYYGFAIEQAAKLKTDKTFKQDSTLLAKADSAFSYVQQKKVTSPVADIFLYRARVAELKDADRNNIIGLAKPFYEKYIELTVAKGAPSDAAKINLVESYDYLGSYYQYKEKDDTKANDNFTKAKELDPNDKLSAYYFATKGAKK